MATHFTQILFIIQHFCCNLGQSDVSRVFLSVAHRDHGTILFEWRKKIRVIRFPASTATPYSGRVSGPYNYPVFATLGAGFPTQDHKSRSQLEARGEEMQSGSCSAKLAGPWSQAVRQRVALRRGGRSRFMSLTLLLGAGFRNRGKTKHFVYNSFHYGEKATMRGHGQVHWCWGYFSFVFLYLDTGSTVPGTVEVLYKY